MGTGADLGTQEPTQGADLGDPASSALAVCFASPKGAEPLLLLTRGLAVPHPCVFTSLSVVTWQQVEPKGFRLDPRRPCLDVAVICPGGGRVPAILSPSFPLWYRVPSTWIILCCFPTGTRR